MGPDLRFVRGQPFFHIRPSFIFGGCDRVSRLGFSLFFYYKIKTKAEPDVCGGRTQGRRTTAAWALKAH
jgi:hypothetical protein